MTRRIVSFTAALLLALPGLVALAQEKDAGKQTQPLGITLEVPEGRRVVAGEVLEIILPEEPRPDVEQDDSELAIRRGLRWLSLSHEGPDVEQDALELAMAEDVEVMKRILDETLEDAYQPANQEVWVSYIGGESSLMTLRGMDVDSALGGSQIEDALATYLDGYGVVFQLKAPPLREEPEKQEAELSLEAEPPTRWEATRLRLLGIPGHRIQLKGDNAELEAGALSLHVEFPTSSDAVPTKSLLTQKLLDLLAENGHNFRRLKPEERLTVALTFRTGVPSDDGKPRDAMYRNLGDGRFEDVSEKISGQTDIVSRVGGATMDFDDDGDLDLFVMGGPGKETDELTGDLHLRQGNYQDAIAAYEKAIREAVKGDPYGRQPTGEQVSMYQKLLQAQVGAGQYAKARQLMEAIQNARARPPSPERPKRHFPARLVVSATKAQLDQVAAGTMTREQFAEEAMVEYSEPKPLEGEDPDTSHARPSEY